MMISRFSTAVLTFALASGTAMAAAPAPEYVQQIEQQRDARVERLRQPQGWLSLVGLHWIEPGTHTLGRATDNDIVLNTGPQHLGTVERTEAGVTFRPLADAGATLDGVAAPADIELAADQTGAPTNIVFDNGHAAFQLIERSGRLGLRVRDDRAQTRADFTGLDVYPIDPSWRVHARFEAHPPGTTIDIASVINTLEPTPNPGVLVFEKDGREHRIEALDNGDGSLFLIVADRTSGRETYGAGRFIYTEAPVDGHVDVDFNLALNPPCAFNEYSTCPLPPPENRLDLAVTAGEKKYAGAAH